MESNEQTEPRSGNLTDWTDRVAIVTRAASAAGGGHDLWRTFGPVIAGQQRLK